MAFKLPDRVRMTVSGTPGTGDVALGLATAGSQSLSVAGLSDGDTFSYVIEDTGNAWEVGVGTYHSSGPSFTRTTVRASSGGGTSKISATSGAIVYSAICGEDVGGGGGGSPYVGGTPPTIVQTATNQQTSGAGSVTMTSAPVSGNLLVAMVYNTGSNPSTGSGWTLIAQNATGNVGVSVYTKTAGASESTTQTPTTGAGGNTAQVIWEINGAVSGVVFNQVASDTPNVLSAAIPSVPAVSASLFLTSLAVSATSNTFTVYGLSSATTMGGSGAAAFYGYSDSTSAQAFGAGVMFSSSAAYGFGAVVIK